MRSMVEGAHCPERPSPLIPANAGIHIRANKTGLGETTLGSRVRGNERLEISPRSGDMRPVCSRPEDLPYPRMILAR
jgi:hypothetical protein